MDLRQILNRPPKRQRLDEEGDTHAQRSPSRHAPSWGQNLNAPATTAFHTQRHCSIFSNSASTTPNAAPIHTPLRADHCNNDRGNYYPQPGYAGCLATDAPSQSNELLQWHLSEVSTIPVSHTWPLQYSIPPVPIAPLQAHTPMHASHYEQSLDAHTLSSQPNATLQWPESNERQALSPFTTGDSTSSQLRVEQDLSTAEARDTTVCFGMVSNTWDSCDRSSTKTPDIGHLRSVRAKGNHSAESANTFSCQARIVNSLYGRKQDRDCGTHNVRPWAGCTGSS
jgi:hypothetical protein